MADKNYSTKLKIGNSIFWLKDTEAQNAITLLNSAIGVSGSVADSIYNNSKDALYAYTFTEKEGVLAVGDYVKVDNEYVEVTVDNISTYSESTPYTRSALTISEAIEDAANSIGTLTVNGKSADSQMRIVIDTTDIKREDGTTVLEVSLTTIEDDLTTLKGSASTEGSVKYTVKTEAKDANYLDAVTTYSNKTGENAETPEVGDFYKVNDEYVEITADNIGEVPAETQLYTATTTNAKTIAQGITANTNAINALDTRVTSLEGTRTTLLADNSTEGSIDYRIKNQAGDATTKLTVGGEDTTITAAIQSLQSQVSNANKGQFKVVYEVDQENGTITPENGDEPIAIGADNLGFIYLVFHEGEETAAGEKVPDHYDEWIVFNAGTENDPDYRLEKIGDTEITLAGYATEDWVTANAKNGSYSSAVSATYKVATEFEEGVTYYSDAEGTVADPQPVDDTNIGNYYVVDTPAKSAMTIAQAIASNTTAIENEVTRATTAEDALDDKIDALDAETVKSVNNITVTTGTNNVTITSADINHTDTNNVVTYEESDTQTVAVDKYVYVNDEYVLVTEDNIADFSEYAGTVYDKVVTPTDTTVTIAQQLNTLKANIATESARATNAEDALDARVDTLEDKVNGETVHSVNGVEATAQNQGDITLLPSDITYQEATTATKGIWSISSNLYNANMEATTEPVGTAGTSVNIGTVYIGQEADVHAVEGVWYTKSGDDWYEVESLGDSAFVLGTEVTDSEIVAELEEKTTSAVTYTPYSVQVPKVTVEDALDDILNRLSSMNGTTGSAITSVEVRSGTGTWAVDSVDAEQLNWTDIVLDTTSATFLAASAE